MRSKRKQVKFHYYSYPKMRLTIGTRDGKLYTTSINSCRESLISTLYTNYIKPNLEKENSSLTIEMGFSMPLSVSPGNHRMLKLGGYDRNWSPKVSPNSRPVKRFQKLWKSPRRLQKFAELISYCTMAVAAYCEGISCLTGKGVSVKKEYPPKKPIMNSVAAIPLYEYTEDIRVRFECFNSQIIRHPAILSIILCQARWVMDQLLNGKFIETYNSLEPVKGLRHLQRALRSGETSPILKRYLEEHLSLVARLSQVPHIKAGEDRYAITPKTLPHIKKLSTKDKLSARSIWIEESSKGPYVGNLYSYGIYKYISLRGHNIAPPTQSDYNPLRAVI